MSFSLFMCLYAFFCSHPIPNYPVLPHNSPFFFFFKSYRLYYRTTYCSQHTHSCRNVANIHKNPVFSICSGECLGIRWSKFLQFPLENLRVLLQETEMEERVNMTFFLFVSTSDTPMFCYSLLGEKIPGYLCLTARKMLSKSSTVKLDFRSHVSIKEKIFHIKPLQ